MKTRETCQVSCIHTDVVDDVMSRMAANEALLELADLFKALGDGTRTRILHALSFSELCVCDLAQLLNMSASSVSHQLRVLRTQRIVKYRKAGKMVFYSLNDAHILDILALGLDHVTE